MNAVKTLAVAMWKGFIRDKAAVFFSLVFPLMFLVLFGGIFTDAGQSRSDLLQVGDVALIDELPDEARARFDDSFDVHGSDDLGDAVEQVRTGAADAAVTEDGDRLVLYFSQADQVQAAIVQGVLGAYVSQANLVATGRPPTYTLQPQQVEDESLESIQYVTPGLLGWAVALQATFGAALTLVTWRDSKLLRRLRLAPVSTASIVAARIGVTLGSRPGADGHLPRPGRRGLRAAADRFLVDGGPDSFLRHAGVHGDRPARRGHLQDLRRGVRVRQLHRLADGLLVRLVHPARRGTELDPDGVQGLAAALPQRRHARHHGARRGAGGGAGPDGGAAGVRVGHRFHRDACVPVGVELTGHSRIS